MENNTELYKQLFENKKFEEIIQKIEILEKVKSPQILHLLGICKLLKNNSTKEDRISARENFRRVFIEDQNSKRGIEALTNFINLNTDFYEIKNSLEYYSNVNEKYSTDLKLLKAISRVYQFSNNIKERIKILEKISLEYGRQSIIAGIDILENNNTFKIFIDRSLK